MSVSACALFSSKLADCSAPKTESRCDKMNMGDDGPPVVIALDQSCCFVSQAPLSESRFEASALSLVTPLAVSVPTETAPRVHQMPSVLLLQDLSPPPLQSLLCTFLI
jgi:hypothetical protein